MKRIAYPLRFNFRRQKNLIGIAARIVRVLNLDLLESCAAIHKESIASLDYERILARSIEQNKNKQGKEKGPVEAPSYSLCRLRAGEEALSYVAQLHPVVVPQVSHFRQVPFRTIVKLWHSVHWSPV